MPHSPAVLVVAMVYLLEMPAVGWAGDDPGLATGSTWPEVRLEVLSSPARFNHPRSLGDRLGDQRPNAARAFETLAVPTVISPGDTVGMETRRPSVFPETAFVVFDAPATFPATHFDRYGQRSHYPGVLIHEGMAIALFDDGTYVLRMVVETPPTNVDMRLQFTVRTRAPAAPGSVTMLTSDDHAGLANTITPPVIRFRPTADQKRQSDTLYWRVEQSGHSSILASLMARQATDSDDRFASHGQPSTAPVPVDGRLVIQRRGSAEWGSAPQTTGY